MLQGTLTKRHSNIVNCAKGARRRAIVSAERDGGGQRETENHVNGSGQIAENARKMRSEPERRQNRGDDDNTCKLIKGHARVWRSTRWAKGCFYCG